MRQRLLVEARPAAAALRYFLTAPVFGMLLGLLLLADPAALDSRWNASALAATHLLALGVLAMVMLGALWQMLPVVCGLALPCAAGASRALHALLSAGSAALALAFLLHQAFLFSLAGSLLMLAVCLALAVFLLPLLRYWRVQPRALAHGVRLALLGLGLTAMVGLSMLGARLGLLPVWGLTDLHARLGGAAWVGGLIVAISFQVMPMFQVTPPYPLWLSRVLPWLLLPGVLWPPLHGIVLGTYALCSLYLLWRRPRPPEASTAFWVLGMLCLPLALGAFCYGKSVAGGLLFLYGFAWSIVTGMLYKILPFLLWQGWSESGRARPVKSFRLIIPEGGMRAHFLLHLAALPLLLQTPRAGGACLLISQAWLALQLWRAVRL